MIALTPNAGDLILAAVLGAAVVIGLVGYLLGGPEGGLKPGWWGRVEDDPRPCRCMFCRDLRAGR